jgi:hypothetical protein
MNILHNQPGWLTTDPTAGYMLHRSRDDDPYRSVCGSAILAGKPAMLNACLAHRIAVCPTCFPAELTKVRP